MPIPFQTTEELQVNLRGYRESLRMLQTHEPNWRRADRSRGLATIAKVIERINETEIELAMATAR